MTNPKPQHPNPKSQCGLGASDAFSSVVAASTAVVQGTDAALTSPAVAPYLSRGTSNPLNDWLVFELAGVVIGGLVSAWLAGRLRASVERGPAIRGGTVTFNVQRHGRVLAYETVERAAREHGIAIRGGCFCNPGTAEHAFAIPAERARQCLRRVFSVDRLRSCLEGQPVGAVRASIGIPTNETDLDRLAELVTELTA
jgi:hypothetical protein